MTNLDEDEDVIFSPSYFWSCVTLANDCPFFSPQDPKLRQFGYGMAGLYGAFLLMVLLDVGFYWTLDKMQKQIDYYINLVTRKVKHVQKDQRKLITTKERAERLLKKSRDRTRMLSGLRSVMTTGDPHILNMTRGLEETSTSDEITWSNLNNFAEL